MQKYLENDVCIFTPLKKIDYNIKKSFIVSSLFRMKLGGYKNFMNYLNGIKILCETAKEKNLEVRIFIDSTIKNDERTMAYLNKFDNLTLILYKCSDFLINDYHVGLFGTLVRFFPLFDFPNNDADIVFLADTDTKTQYINELINLYEKLVHHNVLRKMYLGYNGRYFHVNISPKKVINVGDKKHKIYLPYCIAQKFFGIQRIPKMPFIKFFKKIFLYMNENTRPEKILSDYYIDPEKYKIKCENNICFGIDEYFVNNILFKYLMKKKIPFCYYSNYDLAQFYYFKHPKIVDWNLINVSKEEYLNKFNGYMKEAKLDKYTFEEIDTQIFSHDENFENEIDSQTSEFMNFFARHLIPVLEKIIINKDYSVYSKAQLYSMKQVEYKKYFRSRGIKFMNSNIDNIIYNKCKIDV